MAKPKVVVFGAGGILGQHMLLQRPSATFFRRRPHPLYHDGDLTDYDWLNATLDRIDPDVVINLAGENRVDVVEDDPDAAWPINVGVPNRLAEWCDRHGRHLIQVSTQGVFSGLHAPYQPYDEPHPITAYGRQKAEAEVLVRGHRHWTIARVTFVLGVRPFPAIGRTNPLEVMFSAPSQRQVEDRWFSASFAPDVASRLWTMADLPIAQKIVHLGVPDRVSRHSLALQAAPDAEVIAVSDDEFPGVNRPVDSHWAEGSGHSMDLTLGIASAAIEWQRRSALSLSGRAREISLFLHTTQAETERRLGLGFIPLHHAVAEDFRAAAPTSEEELLAWYMSTDAYIWELSAYHLDAGFNYSGMCAGILERLTSWAKSDVLVLGDGIGDLSMVLKGGGLAPVYHDLLGSRTANFATFRHYMAFEDGIPCMWTDGWTADFGTNRWDAIVALDLFEHLTDVEGWVKAAWRGLRSGGFFMAQNAFAIGDDDHGGSIPMHLTTNNRYEKDWTPLMAEVGFKHDVDVWWVKP